MSRRPKLDYDFCPMPRRRHAAWAGASLFETGLRDRLFELNDGGPITVDGPWEESLCKQAAVNGPDRSNARRALRKWVARRLLSVDGSTVSIVFRHGESLRVQSEVTPGSLAPHSEVTPGSVRGQSEVTFDSTPRNDSNHVGETDRQTDETERVRARARESSARFEKPPVGEAPPNTPPSEPKPVSPELQCWKLYQRALGTEHLMLAPNHREALSVLASAAKGEADGATQGEAFDRAVQRILAAWMAEKYWKDKRPGLRNLAERIEAGNLVRPKSVAKVLPFEQLSAHELTQKYIREQDEQRARRDAAGGAS
jgi:hypothetical protein